MTNKFIFQSSGTNNQKAARRTRIPPAPGRFRPHFHEEESRKNLTCYQKNGMVKTVIRLTDLSGIDHGKYNAIISRPSGHFHGCPDRGLFSMEKLRFGTE